MKTKLTVCFILFFSSLNAQILNAGFEDWDTLFSVIEVPQDWLIGDELISFQFKDSISVNEGSYSILLNGRYGFADGPVPRFVQQNFLVPYGLEEISFLGKAQFYSEEFVLSEFFGYGLTKDSIDPKEYYQFKFLAGGYSMDTTSQFQNFSIVVPDSLWKQEVFLTFICEPTGLRGFSPFIVDNIQLHIDSTVSIKKIENQSINIYPNPTSDFLYLKNLPISTIELEIHSSNGKLVWKGEPQNKINVSDFRLGNYFLVGKDGLGKILFTNSFIKH